MLEAETVGVPWDIDESTPTAKHIPKNVSRRTSVSPYATADIRLLLFTGARLREILARSKREAFSESIGPRRYVP